MWYLADSFSRCDSSECGGLEGGGSECKAWGACQKLSCKVRWVVVNCIIKVKVKVYR